MTLTPQQKLEYYRKKQLAERIILAQARRGKHIIYGERAVSAQLKPALRKHTEDYDLFARQPRRTASMVEKRLDQRYGFNAFKIAPAKHRGTYKVVSRVTQRNVADYSNPPRRVQYVRRDGVRYAALSYQLQKIRESLASRNAKFRHAKDRETRQRILLNKQAQLRRRKQSVLRRLMRGSVYR